MKGCLELGQGFPALFSLSSFPCPPTGTFVDILFQIAFPSPRNFSTTAIVHMFMYCGLWRAANHRNMYDFLFLPPESQFSPLWGRYWPTDDARTEVITVEMEKHMQL